jgi:hypothetical protein
MKQGTPGTIRGVLGKLGCRRRLSYGGREAGGHTNLGPLSPLPAIPSTGLMLPHAHSLLLDRSYMPVPTPPR